MSEYDTTNKGAVFPPFPDMSMILQGKIDSNGTEDKVVVVKRVSNAGKPYMEIYASVGVLFSNKSENEKAPQYSGTFRNRSIGGWKHNKDGKNYMSLKVSDKQTSEPDITSKSDTGVPFDDDIPFV